MSPVNKKTVFFVCSGLGNVNRGYESFTRECFDAIKSNDLFDITLFKGGGQDLESEIVIGNIPRASKLAIFFSKFTGLSAYTIEQVTFFFSLVPRLFIKKPNLIFYSDFLLGTYLWHLRRISGLKYKLLFSNGAPNGPPFSRMDHIQMLLPLYYNKARETGVVSSMMTLLPYAIQIPIDQIRKLIKEKDVIKSELKIPLNKKVVLSVGAIDISHKRMDYVIEEFMRLRDFDSFYLILLGATTVETPLVFELMKNNQQKNILITEVSRDSVGRFFAIADYFVLASLNEGLPRVLPEALSYGLLPIVHDYAVTRETLSEYGVFVDMQKNGSLQKAIEAVDQTGLDSNACMKFAYENYSWDHLNNRYVKMLNSLLQ